MKTPRSNLRVLALALLAGGALYADQTQLPISRVSGILAVPLDAGKTTLIGLPFIQEPVTTQITITVVSNPTATSTLLTAAGANFGNFATTPHSVQIIGGSQNGFIVPITSNTADTITTGAVIPDGIVAGLDRLIVIPDWTLGSLDLHAALTANADPALADKVKIWTANGETTTEAAYFYNGTDWRLVSDAGGSSQANVRVPALGGLIIERVAGENKELVFHGVTRTGTQKVYRAPTTTVLITNPFPTDLTLGSSGLDQIIAPAANPAGADTVSIMVSNTLTEFFYQAGKGWKLVSNPGGPVQNNTVFAAGTAALVKGVTTGESVTWPRRWRWARPAKSFAPAPLAPASSIWIGLEPFVAGP